MLFQDKTAQIIPSNTADARKVTPGGGYRLPLSRDAGKVALGGGDRLPSNSAGARRITLGGGYRLAG